MREKIIDIIYSCWSDGTFGKTEPPEVEETLRTIEEHFHASPESYLFLEDTILNLLGLYEKISFIHGFSLGIDLTSGKLFQDTIVS